MNINRNLLEGSLLEYNNPPVINRGKVFFEGESGGKRASFALDEGLLSKHFMLIGGTGCGKTNTFFHIVSQLKYNMTDDDVMIIFDTKGDYKEEFFNAKKDSILSVSDDATVIWNIFSEILADGESRKDVAANVNEIAWGLFAESIRKNNSNPFFPNAARDLFSAVLTCLIRKVQKEQLPREKYLNNDYLQYLMSRFNVELLKGLLQGNRDQMSVMTYVGETANTQGLGVFAELQAVIRQVLTDNFAEKGDFSIKKFVRERGAKTLFIEYNLSYGQMLVPVYKLLIDLALKEAMGDDAKNRTNRGNVYVFCDEFKLLPDLMHISDAVNFGRSLGVKVFAGLQSIDQLIENYGEARAKNIIAGFSSVFSFRANDSSTRQFVADRYGKNYVLEQTISVQGSIHEERRLGNVVEDWQQNTLQVGESVVGLLGFPPFRFRFDLYRG